MSYIEVTGKTEEEAVRKALTQLGLERDDVSLEILERAKSGFLGIGGSPARIRVTYGTDEPEEKKAEPTKKVEKKPEPKAEVKKPEVRPEPKKQEPKKPETKPVEKAPEQKAAAGTCDDDNAHHIREFLEGLLQHMNSPAQVNVALEEKGRYQVRSEEHTSELQSPDHLVCRLLLEKTTLSTPERISASGSTWTPRTIGPSGSRVWSLWPGRWPVRSPSIAAA